jgi:hypothetical protein
VGSARAEAVQVLPPLEGNPQASAFCKAKQFIQARPLFPFLDPNLVDFLFPIEQAFPDGVKSGDYEGVLFCAVIPDDRPPYVSPQRLRGHREGD